MRRSLKALHLSNEFLLQTIDMREWNEQAKNVLEWSTADDAEESEDFLSMKRFKHEEVLR